MGRYVTNRSFAPRVDITGTGVGITYGHDAVHRDIIINASDYTVAGTSDVVYFFKTPDVKQVHLEYSVVGSAALTVKFYEEPVVATAGTVIDSARLFRGSERVTGAVVTKGGTVTGEDFGTLLKTQSNGGGGVGSGVRGGSAVHDDVEWVLKVDTYYAMVITRGASGTVGVEFEWYEVPEITVFL